MAESTHPGGFSPADLAAMNTAGQQSAGGSQAAAVGQGALLAGRTRNAGTADAAIAESTRQAGRNLSDAALKTQMENAQLKESQKQAAREGLGRLYSTSVSGANTALGETAANEEADARQKQNSFWGQMGQAVASGIGKRLGGGMGGFGGFGLGG